MPASFDARELDVLAHDLDRAAGVAPADARKVVGQGALNIKRDAQRRRAGSKYLPRLAAAINYDSHETPHGGWSEVGPDHARPQGNLGHIPENGTLTNAPEPYMAPAAAAEQPRFEKAMQGLAVKAAGLE
jgi:hypothetical protein